MKILIVYYSRTGVTHKTAEAIRDAIQRMGDEQTVDLERITEAKDRKGVLGYLGAGKDAMSRKATPIEPVQADPAAYEVVAVGTPVWAFTMASPVRSFLQAYAEKLPKTALFSTMGGSGDKKTFAAMEQLLGKPPIATLGLVERHVTRNDPEKFQAKVDAFAKALIGSQSSSAPEQAS